MPKKKKEPPKPPTASEVASSVVTLLQTHYKDQSVALFDDDLVYFEPKHWVHTDVLAFQASLGDRGIPTGRIIEIQGWESSGKSTLLDMLMGSFQRYGHLACLADTEMSRQKSYTERLGVDKKSLVVLQARTIEGIGSRILTFLQKVQASGYEGCTMIGWDTVANTPSKAELEAFLSRAKKGKEEKKSGMMDAARAIKEFFRALTAELTSSNAVLVVTNQFYEGPPEWRGGPKVIKTYGGNALRYMPSIRVEVVKRKPYIVGERRVGHFGEFVNVKNKLRDPHISCPFLLVYGIGFDNVYTVSEVLHQNGIATTEGSWKKIAASDLHDYAGKDVAWQNMTQLNKRICEDEPLWNAMVAEFWRCMGM
jgi:recombination protein RecA